jgi:predicted small lipoprotein YifL
MVMKKQLLTLLSIACLVSLLPACGKKGKAKTEKRYKKSSPKKHRKNKHISNDMMEDMDEEEMK